MRITIFTLLLLPLALFACNNTPESAGTTAAQPQEETAASAQPVTLDAPATVSTDAQREHAEPAGTNAPAVAPENKSVSGAKQKDTKTTVSKPVITIKEEPAAATAKTSAIQPVQEQPVVQKQPEPTLVVEDKPAAAVPPSHDAWDKLLQQYVSASGKVDYAGFKKDKAKLDAYLETLKNNPPQNNWPKAEKMAYWINAYNAFTVDLIVDNYPIASITKLDGGKPWDVKRIKLGDKTYSLNNIENDILRPQFKDARIHFAVNCAAKSCPPLLNRAWTAANLESNFEKQAKAFINNSQFNKIGAKEVQVSKIFEWYAADFGNLIDYLNKYSNTKINANAKVGYMEYDWNLNN